MIDDRIKNSKVKQILTILKQYNSRLPKGDWHLSVEWLGWIKIKCMVDYYLLGLGRKIPKFSLVNDIKKIIPSIDTLGSFYTWLILYTPN